jgi:hypothetical protein
MGARPAGPALSAMVAPVADTNVGLLMRERVNATKDAPSHGDEQGCWLLWGGRGEPGWSEAAWLSCGHPHAGKRGACSDPRRGHASDPYGLTVLSRLSASTEERPRLSAAAHEKARPGEGAG